MNTVSIAEAAAHILVTEGHENKTYPLTNTESVSFADVAQALSATLGKTVHYQSPSVTEFEATMKQFGVPELYISMFIMWAEALEQGTMDLQDDTLQGFLGRKPATLNQFTNQVYG